MKNSFKSFLVLIIICLAGAASGANSSLPQASAPQIDSISTLSLERAGRLRIFGANFGAIKAASHVLIDGVPAPVSRWSDTLVVAYIPETAQLATVPVQVITNAGSSNNLLLEVKANNLEVMAPQANGSIQWRFEVDGDYMGFRPTIGPDGTIYFQDVNGHLYALRPDGRVKWIFQGGYPAGPVAVGTDNTTYIASGSTIQAISPTGTLVWQFTDPNSQGVIGGPAVGPDGKIYAAMDLVGLGAIALSPVDGHLVWSNSGDPRLAEHGQLGLDLVFGSASSGAQPDQFYFTCDNVTTSPQGHLYAFSLNGNQRWAVSLGGISQAPQVAVAPNGSISLGVAAFDPSNGLLQWSAYSALGSGSNLPPAIGPDGTVYVLAQHQSALAALNGQSGAVLWRVTGVGFEQGPVVSPLNDVIVVGGRDNYGLPGYFKAFSTGGQSLWQINLPGEPYPGIFEFPFNEGRFSLDGTTVYLGTTISGEAPDNEHCYLYALQTANSQTCTYAISSLSMTMTSIGGEGSVDVTAPNGCSWTAVSNDLWITITSGASGTGNGMINFTVAANTAGSRVGTITIAGQVFTVQEEEATPGCPYAITPSSQVFAAVGGSNDIAVTTDAGCNWTAASNDLWINITSGASGTSDGLVTYAIAANDNHTSRTGTMTVAGQTFAVMQAAKVTPFGFDGDAKSDISVWRPSTGVWFIINSSNLSITSVGWGVNGDKPVSGNFDGDGKVDIAIWRPSTGVWFIRNSSNGSVRTLGWGINGDVPVPGDYDGDGKTDIAIWRPSSGIWYIVNSHDDSITTRAWGESTDISVSGDYDGDGKTDIAVWRPGNGRWFIINSSNGSIRTETWGISGDKPVVSDYDGDGKSDLAIWRPSSGIWYIVNSANASVTVRLWGESTDIPVPGDYDGDGKTDIAQWRPVNGRWFIIGSAGGSLPVTTWGINGDVAVPSVSVP
jgi:hypothetical protein